MPARAETAPKSTEIAQTLDRGLQVLEAMADTDGGMSIAEVAERLGVHRTVAARLLATLVHRRFATRHRDGRYVLGAKLLTLARGVSGDVLVVAGPFLSEIAERLDATAVLHVADGDEAVSLASVEPRRATFHVGLRPGGRHPLTVAADGLAILAGRPPVEGERDRVAEARRRGYAVTIGELIPGFLGVSAPVPVNGWADTSVGVVVPQSRECDEQAIGREVMALAESIAQRLL